MGLTRQSTWATVALVAFACGGKTETLEDVDPGGSASGGSAQGNGGSSGAAGRGGSPGGAAGAGALPGVGGAFPGRGGSTSPGGFPGSGGSAGIGIGGVGAAPGGMNGASGSGGAVIEAMCRHYETHGCSRAEGCRETYTNGFDIAEQTGCGDEWLTIFSCVLNDPTPCDAPAGCNEGIPIHKKCVDEANPCIRGNNPMTGGCVMGCVAWTVECRLSNAGQHCICTKGPRAGTGFDTSAACESDEWLNTALAACQ